MYYQWDVFISFAWKDIVRARKLRDDLARAGFAAWYAEDRIPAGGSIPGALREGLNRSRFLAIIHSKHHAASKWAGLEYDAALYDEVGSGQTKIVFLKFDDAELPFDARHKKFLTFSRNRAAALAELTALFSQASGSVIDGVRAEMEAGQNWVQCAHRLGDIARFRGDIHALEAIAAILLGKPADYNVRDSAAWALGYVAIWATADTHIRLIRGTVDACIAAGDARLIDKMAYICGEMALNATDSGLKSWADIAINRHRISHDLQIATPFAFTRDRVDAVARSVGSVLV